MRKGQHYIGWCFSMVERYRFGFIVSALLLLCALFALHAPSTSALTTVPTRMNFQGRLTDAGGIAKANGNYNMRLRLFTASSGGTAVWTEDRLVSAGNGVAVTNGLFSIQLGSVTTLPASLFASGSLYLEVELPTPASATTSSPVWTEGAMTPRNQMATSAYAYNAETLDGLDSSDFGRVNANNIFTGTNTFNVSSASALDVQNGSSVSVFKVDTSSATVTVAANTVISAGKTLTVVGDTTANRASAPTEGTIYFDTTTKQLLTYSNGKWQADGKDMLIVAASNSSQSDKDAANYVADGDTAAAGDGDQVQINQALTAASGKKVMLLAGTYTIDASISVPNNTIVTGVGQGTLITLPNSFNTNVNALSLGNNVTVRDMQLDGNKANQTSGNMYGVYFNASTGAKVVNVAANNWRVAGFQFASANYNTVTNSTAQSNGSMGMSLSASSNNTITDSTVQNNVSYGIYMTGFDPSISAKNIVSGNNIGGNVTGVYIFSDSVAANNTVTGNSVHDNTTSGIALSTTYANLVSGNTLSDNGGAASNQAITVVGATSNTITSNVITDAAASTNQAIVLNSGSNGNYLADNTLGGGSISDNSPTLNIYAGQVNSAGNYLVQPAGTVELMKNTNISGDLTVRNVTIAAGKTLAIVGGTTGTRPASPTEGMIYFDTTTKQLLTYSNGKWQSDRSTATKIVAASTSSQTAKDSADYVATGTDDGVTINTALSALPAGGGTVYLMEGTYSLGTTSINMPNNSTLAGTGAATVLTYPAAMANATYKAITNSDTATGTHVNIRDLMIDGNRDNQSAGNFYGIYFDHMGSGSGSSAVDGGKITNVVVANMYGWGIYLTTSSNNTISNNTVRATNVYGILLAITSTNNTITGNTFQYNTTAGIGISSSNNNTVSGNIAQGNNYGIFVQSASTNTITGNTLQGGTNYGMRFDTSTNNTVTGNTIRDNGTRGITLGVSSNGNNITSNSFYDNGGSTANNAIYLDASDSNTISSNTINDSSATTTNYAININNNTADTNYLVGNTLGGGSINDAGTGTIYGGQINNLGALINQSSGGLTIQSAPNAQIFSATSTTGVQIGNSAADATGTVLILDTKNTAGDPTGTNGAMYYNSNLGKLRCYQAGAWADCITATPATPATQATYTASTGGTTPEVKLDSTRGGFDVQDADTTIAGNLFAVRGSNAGGLGSALFGVTSTGVVTAQNSTDSTAAFSINNATAGSLLVADTTNSRIQIGSATADANGVVLVLDTKNTAGDPTGVDGAMYYNSSSKSFRCYQNGVWRSCIGGLASSNTTTASVNGSAAAINTPITLGTSYTIPAGDCQPGRVYRVSVRGVLTSANTLSPGTITIRLKLASGTIFGSSGALSPGQNKVNRMWQIDFNILCTTYGPSGNIEGQGLFVGYPSAAGTLVTAELNNNPSGVTLDLTAAQTLQVDAAFSVANAGNIVTVRQFVVESLGP